MHLYLLPLRAAFLPNFVKIEECELARDLISCQEDAPVTHQSVLAISLNTEICRSSVGHIIHDLSTATLPEVGKHIVPTRLLIVFLGSAATQLR